MTEWGVVGVIIALVGVIATLVKPVVSLTRSITELTVMMKQVSGDLGELTEKNSKSHERLWDHNEAQDEKLADHEKRIGHLEQKR